MKSVNTFGSLKPMLKETTSSSIKIPKISTGKKNYKESLTKRTKFSKLKSSLKV